MAAASKGEDESYYVCHRVEDLIDSRPESIKGACSMCHHEIYMMPEAPDHMPKICWRCFHEVIENADDDDEVTFFPGEMARQKYKQ